MKLYVIKSFIKLKYTTFQTFLKITRSNISELHCQAICFTNVAYIYVTYIWTLVLNFLKDIRDFILGGNCLGYSISLFHFVNTMAISLYFKPYSAELLKWTYPLACLELYIASFWGYPDENLKLAGQQSLQVGVQS